MRNLPLPNPRSFVGVALFLILTGAAIMALGVVQLVGAMVWQWQFGWPVAKIMGGLIVTALGYVVLQLELLRQKK